MKPYFGNFIAKLGDASSSLFGRKIFKSLLLSALIGTSSSVYGTSGSPEYHVIIDLSNSRNFDEAFELLKDFDFEKEPDAYTIKAVLSGSGVLSGGQDICAAAADIEKIILLSRGKFRGGLGPFTGALNYIYGGDWASIAALEGQPTALYILGERILANINKSSNPIYLMDSSKVYEDIYVYFYNSAKLGMYYAEGRRDAAESTLKRNFPEVDYISLQSSMEFKQILCPVREFALGN